MESAVALRWSLRLHSNTQVPASVTVPLHQVSTAPSTAPSTCTLDHSTTETSTLGMQEQATHRHFRKLLVGAGCRTTAASSVHVGCTRVHMHAHTQQWPRPWAQAQARRDMHARYCSSPLPSATHKPEANRRKIQHHFPENPPHHSAPRTLATHSPEEAFAQLGTKLGETFTQCLHGEGVFCATLFVIALFLHVALVSLTQPSVSFQPM